ncbi:hypothetical protein VTK73DRAFT_7045 [Phialemonium thermophilum]|uniref:Uncharacterized protein n=1 Tax=Phialemonium thermophilum TaxID=223376 RepID=A0ABR3WH48_9PEZI
MEPPVAPRPQGQGKQPVAFPKLEKLDPSEPHSFFQPVKRINDGPDVARFLTSKAYQSRRRRRAPRRQTRAAEIPPAQAAPADPRS